MGEYTIGQLGTELERLGGFDEGIFQRKMNRRGKEIKTL